jgi:glycosyltransferase involved in cell wall biosynthesis
VMAEAAFGFASRGHEVEVLTTTAVDHYSWANELPEGAREESGVVVRRFAAVRQPSRAALKAQLCVQAGHLPGVDHQVSWLGFHFSCPGLFEHIARHGPAYDALVFSPYLFWSTTACLPLAADRAVLMPCLHDEAYARLDLVRATLAMPALVWFLSGPEHRLAHALGPLARLHSVTGAGVPVPKNYDPVGFRRRHGLSKPFLLYAGRREGGKGLSWLLRALAVSGAAVDLVVIGKGEPGSTLSLPPGLAGRVVDLGFVRDSERDDAFAAALAYVQPSLVESFSRTTMEAWLAGTPVLGLASNEVVAWHLRRCGGGLPFSDASSLAAAISRLQTEEGLAAGLAAAGRRYVIEHYTWPVVLDRMEASLRAWTRPPRQAGAPPAAGSGRVLVAGSYPPVPGAPAAAALATVKRFWATGEDTVVASPRPSAARYLLVGSSPVALARQLAALGRREGCGALVLCLEPSWPVPPRWGQLRRRAAVLVLCYVMGRYFAEAEVVVTGEVELGDMGPLLRKAGRVVASSPEVAAAIHERWPAIALTLACAPAGAVSAGPVSASPLEPGELLVATRARRALGRAARAVLGRHEPAVRAWASKLVASRRPSL